MAIPLFDPIDDQLFRNFHFTTPFALRINGQGGVALDDDESTEFVDGAVPPMDWESFVHVRESNGQPQTTYEFARIFRYIHNHPNWSRLTEFFDKRHKTTWPFANGPKVKYEYGPNRSYRLPVRIDTASVGLPKDLRARLAAASTRAKSSILGDAFPASIGPALGVGLDFEIMDLCYRGVDSKGRSWSDWQELWKSIEDWARDYDYARAIANDLPSIALRGVPESQKHQREINICPQYLWTPLIQVVSAVHWAFSCIAKEPDKFQNFEDDLFRLILGEQFARTIQERFPPDRAEMDVYTGPNTAAPCPRTRKGKDWEQWMYTIKPGQFATPLSNFEARWAAITLSMLKWPLVLMSPSEPWDTYVDKSNVYM